MVGFSQFSALTNWQEACRGMLEAAAVLGSIQNGCHRGTTLCFLAPFHISPPSHQAYSFSNNASPKAAPLASLTRFSLCVGFFFFLLRLWVSFPSRKTWDPSRHVLSFIRKKNPGTFYQTLQMCFPADS